MNIYLIFLIIFGVTTFLYLMGFLVNLVFVKVFLKKFNEHHKALMIAFAQKMELISVLLKTYEKLTDNPNLELDKEFQTIKMEDFNEIASDKANEQRNKLSFLKQELIGLSKNNDSLSKNTVFLSNIESLNMLDDQIRYLLVTYNADIIGYNYWISFKPYSYLFVLNGVKKKDII